MGRLSKMTRVDESEAKKENDNVGGGFQVHDSDVYDVEIEMAYTMESKYGATGVAVRFKNDDGFSYRQTFWVTNRDGENFYTNKKKEKHHLQGYNQANAIAMMGCKGTPLFELKEVVKTIPLYDKDEGKEVPTEVDYLPQLDGVKVKLALMKQLVNKQELQGKKYVDIPETREVNDIAKILQAKSGKTMNELVSKSDSTFMQKWLDKWQGQVQDRTNKNLATTGTATGSNSATDTATKTDAELFD